MRGAWSRYCGAMWSTNTCGGSMTWSSTDTSLISAGSTVKGYRRSVPARLDELEHLLERRAVRGAERVRDDARHETRARGGTAPRRRIGALCRGQLANGLIERRPERRPASIQRPVAAVRQLERSSHSLTKECAQVLVDERLTCETVQSAHGVELAEQVAVHRAHHCLRDRSPHRVHDHCAGVVVAAVEVG